MPSETTVTNVRRQVSLTREELAAGIGSMCGKKIPVESTQSMSLTIVAEGAVVTWQEITQETDGKVQDAAEKKKERAAPSRDAPNAAAKG